MTHSKHRLRNIVITVAIVVGMWQLLKLCLALLITLPSGPKYLDAPPAEFYDFVAGIPTPEGATTVITNIERYIAPQRACTHFIQQSLLGSETDFSSIKQNYLKELHNRGDQWLVASDEAGYLKIVLSADAMIVIADLTDDLPFARLAFSETIYLEARDTYQTVYFFSVDHSYGNCIPDPDWEK